ncbi:sigma factor, partial [uncultured Muribaculum sp.]
MKKSDNNDNRDFQRIVMEQKSTIYSVCYMYATSKEEADDLFQETLVNLWQGFDTFRGDSSIRSWVYRISLNTCLTQ